MSRLGEGSAGLARSMAIAAVAPGGSFAVGSALVLDEVEYYRAGIGCMLENTPEGNIFISIIVRGGAAAVSGMQEGDIVEQVDEHLITPDMGVNTVSGFIRGSAGSMVAITLRKKDGRRVVSNMQRRAVPGGTAEILGSLFGNSFTAKYKEKTLEDKVHKLSHLYQRGNLSVDEYYDAKLRLECGETRQKTPESSINFSGFWSTLTSDLSYAFSDPEVIRRKKAAVEAGAAAAHESIVHGPTAFAHSGRLASAAAGLTPEFNASHSLEPPSLTILAHGNLARTAAATAN